MSITRFHPISLGAPGEEISKKDLHAVVDRFKFLNRCRLQRLQEAFHVRQQEFLNLLPLIFHLNHPLLPGFVSLETPAGIPDYQPSRQTVDTAKLFTKGFSYKHKNLKYYPIHGIFLMGSVGSMAFAKDSDIDIWLCHQPGLSARELQELRRKTVEVEKWAASLKLEAHFFLVDSQQFRQGENTPISHESSGHTQHYILLEEFYRTSIYIAGRVPIWWLVPPAQEVNYRRYVAHLLENRFVSESEVIDFGDLQELPVSEFIGATLWQIYKSLSSPHKSILKLFLMETYALEFPKLQWLSLTLKQAIYSGDVDIDALDPYLLIYRKIDDYLQKHQSRQRLNLVRECLHLKIMGSSHLSLSKRQQGEHEAFMQRVAAQFRWPADLLDNLGMHRYWTIQKACTEHELIRFQLQNSLRIILKTSGGSLDRNSPQYRDLTLINRKLQATLDIAPGKVELLSTRAMVHAAAEVLNIAEPEFGGRWRLYAGHHTAADACIKESGNPVELICWAVLNGLYTRHVHLRLISETWRMNSSEFGQLFNEVGEFLAAKTGGNSAGLQIYDKPNRLRSSLLLINLGETLPFDINAQQFVMSERSDPFSYGEQRLCFVQGMTRVSVTSWGEVVFREFAGLDGFLACLAEIINNSQQPLSVDSLQVYCPTKVRGRSIVWRVKTLFENLIQCFGEPETRRWRRYVMAGEDAYYVFRFSDEGLVYERLEGTGSLLEELGTAQPKYSPVRFDDFVLEQTFIPEIYQYNAADTVQIFYHATGKQVAVYILDEHGALFTAQHGKTEPAHMLRHYAILLGDLLQRGKLPPGLQVQGYEIQKNSRGVVSYHPVPINPRVAGTDLRVRINYEEEHGCYAIYCNEQKFIIRDRENYNAVKEHILGHRKHGEDYACYITGLEAPDRHLGLEEGRPAQTVDYLRFKQKIEYKLNVCAYAEDMGLG